MGPRATIQKADGHRTPCWEKRDAAEVLKNLKTMQRVGWIKRRVKQLSRTK